MKRIFLSAMMSAALIVPVMAAESTTAPMAEHHEHGKGHHHRGHHHRGHHAKMTAAEMKADCEKHVGDLKGDSLTGDEKVLFDAKVDAIKTALGHMDKFSTEKSGVKAAKELYDMCKKKAHKMERAIRGAEKKASKEHKKSEKAEKKAHHDDMKKDEPKMDAKMDDMKKDESKMGDMKKDMGDMKKDMGDVKKDMGDVKKDVSDMKKDEAKK